MAIRDEPSTSPRPSKPGIVDGDRRLPANERPPEPDSPTDLSGRSWWATLKRTVSEFRDDNLADWAAALTYYGVLALFPALIVLVALLGLVGRYPDTTEALIAILGAVTSPAVTDTARGMLEDIVQNKGGAGALFGAGLLGAVWSASGYIGAFMRASNAIYEVEEGRPFWKLRPLQIGVTLVMVLLLALVAVGLVISGPLAQAIGDQVGLGDTALTIWSVAKWPAMLAVVILAFALLYYAAPNVKPPRFRWLTPGGAIAVATWVIASAGFAFYARNFGSYNETYGALGGVIVFLVWLWISNLALLFGAEFDAELERSRQLAAGKPAEDQIQLPPRVPAGDG